MNTNMMNPTWETFVEECHRKIDETFDVLEAGKPFLQPETKVSLAIDMMLALTLNRLGVSESEFTTHLQTTEGQ